MENNTSLLPIPKIRKLAWIIKVKNDKLLRISKTAGQYYKPIDKIVRNKDGSIKKRRHIDRPDGELKMIQKAINSKILKQAIDMLPKEMVGGIKNKSTIDNARPHIGKELVFAIDIRDFYPSTNNKKVLKIWQKYFGCGREVSSVLTKLTTFQHRLPQGAPTSSLLGNFALMPLVTDIKKITDRNNLGLSVYVDDITISGDKDSIYSEIGTVIKLIQKYGYAVSNNKNKKKIMSSNETQIVTGRIVNKKLAVEKQKVQEIRRKIVECCKAKKISTRVKKSIYGRIANISTVDFDLSEKLQDFADSLLIDVEEFWEPKLIEEFRPCNCPDIHLRNSIKKFRNIN
jgi:hypothetical protein